MGSEGFSNILVCVDNSKQSQKALQVGNVLAEKLNSRITLLLVIEESKVDFWDDTEFKAETKRPQVHLKHNSRIYKKAQKILNELTNRVPPQIKCKLVVKVGDPAEEILKISRNKIDLIVIGSRGLGGFAKLLQGSVSNKVSNHARCSVLIVR